MTRRSERLAALINDPSRRSRPVDDQDLVELAGQLSAVRLPEPDPQRSARTRSRLVAAAAREKRGPVRSVRPSRSRWRLWIAAAMAAAAVTGAGVSFAGDAAVDVPRVPPTFGPVAPTSAATSAKAPGGGTGSTSLSAPAVPGSGWSATPGPSAGGSAAVPGPAPATPAASAASSRLPDDVLACLKLLKLPELCV